ncbi:MAG TPA: ATP-binding cassette domain-containing protein [Humisphaera sp.]|nr:ATP-binding cassette domain-containing protein [Humisphaera sp.]
MSQIAGELAIDLKHVAKTYRGRIHALAGIQMHVRRGEIFGLLGPNGAGKSTLVKIMMTVVRPTRAEGLVLGHAIGHKATLAKVGYLPENHRFPKYLTGRQTLEFFGAMAKVDRKTVKRRANELLETVGMSGWADKKVATYSKGMLQRVGLAQAMINDPDLIVLDEPTDGVDPVGRREIRDVLLRMREQGKTVFLNSHLLSELEMICDRVAILVQGRVARQGTVEELTRAQQRYEIELALPNGHVPREQVNEIFRQLGAVMQEKQREPIAPGAKFIPPPPLFAIDSGTLPGGAWVETEGAWIRVGTGDAETMQPILDRLRAAGLSIRRLNPVRQTLEDLFMQAVIDPASGQAVLPGAGPAMNSLPVIPQRVTAKSAPRTVLQ